MCFRIIDKGQLSTPPDGPSLSLYLKEGRVGHMPQFRGTITSKGVVGVIEAGKSEGASP